MAPAAGYRNPVPEDRDAHVRSYLDHLAVERGLAANTLAAYRRDIDRYVVFLRGRSVNGLRDVTRHDISDFLASLGDGAASSAARTVSAVRGLHRFGLLEGWSGVDPTDDVQPPAVPLRLPKALPVFEVEQLLRAAATDGPMALRDSALLEFLYGTGARVTEAVSLDVDDVDREARMVLCLQCPRRLSGAASTGVGSPREGRGRQRRGVVPECARRAADASGGLVGVECGGGAGRDGGAGFAAHIAP